MILNLPWGVLMQYLWKRKITLRNRSLKTRSLPTYLICRPPPPPPPPPPHNGQKFVSRVTSWRRYVMKMSICEGNRPMTDGFAEKGSLMRAFVFSLMLAWTKFWINIRVADDLGRHNDAAVIIIALTAVACNVLTTGPTHAKLVSLTSPCCSGWPCPMNTLKANNGPLGSGGCAGFNARLKSDLVLIFYFNSTNE